MRTLIRILERNQLCCTAQVMSSNSLICSINWRWNTVDLLMFPIFQLLSNPTPWSLLGGVWGPIWSKGWPGRRSNQAQVQVQAQAQAQARGQAQAQTQALLKGEDLKEVHTGCSSSGDSLRINFHRTGEFTPTSAFIHFIPSALRQRVCFSTLSKTIVIFFFCYGIHALDIDLNGPGKCKDLSLKPHFFSNIYLEGGRTSSGLLFRLRCFASPRKRLFCPFLPRPEMSPHWRVARITIGQISQQMSQLDKAHTVFLHQILCGQRSEGRTMLTVQFSLKCDQQMLFLLDNFCVW